MPAISREEAWEYLCVLQDIETKTEREAIAISYAVHALQRVIQKRNAYAANRDMHIEKYRANMQDPEFVRKKREKDKRYRETHREQIREKNRRYQRAKYKKEIVS